MLNLVQEKNSHYFMTLLEFHNYFNNMTLCNWMLVCYHLSIFHLLNLKKNNSNFTMKSFKSYGNLFDLLKDKQNNLMDLLHCSAVFSILEERILNFNKDSLQIFLFKLDQPLPICISKQTLIQVQIEEFNPLIIVALMRKLFYR